MGEAKDTIVFLGTAGARVMVSRQLLASGGAWLELGGSRILLDPGPGCIVQTTRRGRDPTKLDAIILSHRHLDHSSDINIMIEAMTDASRRRRGLVFAPADALENDPVVLSYLRCLPERIELLREGGSYIVGDVRFETPVRHIHGVETYGFIFSTSSYTFSWISDTRYFEGLTQHYRGKLLVLHVVRRERGGLFDHLSLSDARELISSIKPEVAILTHFGMTMWRGKPWEIARGLSEETGTRVISARDGMRFDLAQLGHG
jgi:phosphoribosyl 1,2-cyclic phosphodiesterase